MLRLQLISETRLCIFILFPAAKSAKLLMSLSSPFWSDKKKALPACECKEFDPLIKFPIEEGDFLGKEGETLLLYGSGKEKRVLLLGLGPKQPCLPDTLRRAYAAALKVARCKKMQSINFLLPVTELIGRDMLCCAVIEGVLMTEYTFDQLKGDAARAEGKAPFSSLCFCGFDKKDEALLKKTHTVIRSVNFVRDLVNGNADDVHADALKEHAKGF